MESNNMSALEDLTITDKAYGEAYRVSGEAIAVFGKVQKAYRAMEIGDDEYLRGRAIHTKAMAEWDHAVEASIMRAERQEF